MVDKQLLCRSAGLRVMRLGTWRSLTCSTAWKRTARITYTRATHECEASQIYIGGKHIIKGQLL
jgi:hypothetical protein